MVLFSYISFPVVKMKPLHRNLLLASHLYRASALLTVAAYFFSETAGDTLPELLTVALTLIAAYLIRLGLNWMKWVLLVWEVVYLPGLVTILIEPWTGRAGENIMAIVVEVLQIIALVFLFMPQKDEPTEELDEEGTPMSTEQ